MALFGKAKAWSLQTVIVGIASITASLSRAGLLRDGDDVGRLDLVGAPRCGRGGIGGGITCEKEKFLEALFFGEDEGLLVEDGVSCGVSRSLA